MEQQPTKSWEAGAFDKEKGEWVHTTLNSYDHTRADVGNEGIDIRDLLVSRAAPTKITPTRRGKSFRSDARTLVAGDAQIPFQDPEAFDRFQHAVVETQPDNIVFVGDMVDLPSMSRWSQRSEWVGGTQDAINQYHNFLAQTRSNAPNANISVVHGNHEQRMDDYVRKNAAEALGLKRANAEKELAVLSLQYLVRYDDLEINSIDGYPNGTLWLEDDLKATHGTNVAKGGSNAAKYLRQERETTMYGHTHRQELAYRTFAQRAGGITIAAASPGCLAMVDGTVPGFHHTVDAQGQLVKKAEDWQQGLLVLDHTNNSHHITPVLFTEQGFILDGKRHK